MSLAASSVKKLRTQPLYNCNYNNHSYREAALSKIKKSLWKWRGLVAAPLSWGLIALLRYSGALQGLELAAFDTLMRMRLPQSPDPRIAIVGIDEEDIRRLNTDRFDDRIYAQLLEKLLAMNPRAIGLDIYRDVPREPGNAELTEIFNNYDQIIGIEKVLGEESWQKVAANPVLEAKNQIGANDVIPDHDGRIRRVFINLRSEGKTIPSLGTYLAILYLQAEGIETVDWEQEFPPFKSNDGGYVRAKDGGYQIILNYRGPSRQFEIVSLRDILEDRVDATWGSDRLILIGNVSESSNDLKYVPYTTNANTRMAGVEIHANLTSQIISTILDDYRVIKSWSEFHEWLWIGSWGLLGTVLVWCQREFLLRDVRSLLLILPTPALILISWWAFSLGYWIPLVPSLGALWFGQLAVIFYTAYKSNQIRSTFGRYLDPRVVTDLIENPDALKIGGEKQQITILVSDLRGFTATAEVSTPEKVIDVINYYFGEMATIISEYEGMIDEFLGDGILVLFGVPISQPDDAERAVACAVAMQTRLTQVNQALSQKYPGFSPLQMGIGINTGEVIVGNIGSEKRTKYGVVGNTINLTYRIESCTIGGQIYISEMTRQQVEKCGSKIEIYQSISKHFKGAKKPQTIYDVRSIKGNYNLSLDTTAEVFYPLEEPKVITYQILQGKDIDDHQFKATLEALSVNRAKIHGELAENQELPPALTNIMFSFCDRELGDSQQYIYAKILAEDRETQRLEIAFTSIPSEIKNNLDKLYQQLATNG